MIIVQYKASLHGSWRAWPEGMKDFPSYGWLLQQPVNHPPYLATFTDHAGSVIFYAVRITNRGSMEWNAKDGFDVGVSSLRVWD